MSRLALYILMVFAMVAWGETWISAKILNRYLDAKELIFWRFLFTTIGLVPIILVAKKSFKISMYNIAIVLISAILLSLYNGAFFLGTKYGLASIGGVLVTTLNPIITFFIISIIKKKRFSKIEAIGLVIGVIGALIMLEIWYFKLDLIFSKGNIYYLIASFLWPFLTIISSKQKDINPMIFSFYLFLFTSVFSLIWSGHISNILEFDSIFWINLLLLSLFGTTFATTIYFLAVTKLGSKIASSFFFLVPSSAIIFAIIFLGEKISLALIVGGVLSILAVYIINLGAKN